MAVIEILEEEGDLGVGVGGVKIISERCLIEQTKEKMRLSIVSKFQKFP